MRFERFFFSLLKTDFDRTRLCDCNAWSDDDNEEKRVKKSSKTNRQKKISTQWAHNKQQEDFTSFTTKIDTVSRGTTDLDFRSIEVFDKGEK